MIDDDRLKKAFEMLYTISGHNTFTEAFEAEIREICTARNKEAEKEKRELIEVFKRIICDGWINQKIDQNGNRTYCRQYTPTNNREYFTIEELIEKHTGKPIDEVTK